MSELTISDLHVEIAGKEILKGVNLTLKTGEIHAIMGPNGTGKSTLSESIMGNPAYKVTRGSVKLDGQELLGLPVDERARAGIFLAMQYPAEIPGVTNAEFIRGALNARRPEDDPISVRELLPELYEKMAFLDMKPEMAQRYLNHGFSGGEKKRNEILQMMMISQYLLVDLI